MVKIALLHATPIAMEPIRKAFERNWPEAETVNILDDGLTTDRAQNGNKLSENLINRFLDFGRYASRIGADGILVTCSAFGPAIDRLMDELLVPVVKPNEAMFREAMAAGGRIGMLATFAPAVSTMEEEFRVFAAETGVTATLDTIVVADAIDSLRQGEAATHHRLVAARAAELAGHDAIMLAHFSTSGAVGAVRNVVGVPVLSAPDAAVARMRSLITC